MGLLEGPYFMHQRKNCYKVTVLTLDPMASTVLILNILRFKNKVLAYHLVNKKTTKAEHIALNFGILCLAFVLKKRGGKTKNSTCGF